MGSMPDRAESGHVKVSLFTEGLKVLPIKERKEVLVENFVL
jgi:hypothetical protein